MSRKVFLFICLLPAVFLPAALTEAQPSTKISRIGYLGGVSPSANADRIDAFRRGLRALGYIEGNNILIDWRHAEAARLDVLPALAAELVGLNVQIIVTGGPPATRSAKEATATIPIVMGFDDDPIGNGFVASLARPGGNITGLSALAPEVYGKQLELLKEIVPKVSRVTVLGTSTRPGNTQALKAIELTAHALGVKLQYLDVLKPKDLETSFRAAANGRPEAVLVLSSPVFASQRTKMADLAAKTRVPAIYPQQEFVQEGALMTYGVSVTDMYRRAATYVDKILKGANPADLPIEQPKKFELVINLKTAKQIGLTIPPNVLARADRVIK